MISKLLLLALALRVSGQTSENAFCPEDDGLDYTPGAGGTYTIACNTNFTPGQDLDVSDQISLAACLDRCSEYNNNNPEVRCAGANLDVENLICYLKAVTDGAFFEEGVDSGVLQIDAGQPDTINCPQDDGETFTASNGNNYTINCGTDFAVFNDLDISTQPTFDACLEACSAFNEGNPETPCAGAAYTPGTEQCYLKPNTGGAFSDENTNAGFLQVDSGTDPNADGPTCPDDNGQTYTEVETNDVYNIGCSTDYSPGQDLETTEQASFRACLDRCSAYNVQVAAGQTEGNVECAGAVYRQEITTCYLKANVDTPIPNEQVSAGVLQQDNNNPDPDPQSPTCPDDNGETYNEPESNDVYTIACATNYAPGEDLDITEQTSIAACLDRCSAYNVEIAQSEDNLGEECAGAVFSPSLSLCYLKANVAEAIPDELYDSGVLERNGTDPNPDPDPTGDLCPDQDGQVFTDPTTGDNYTVACGTNFAPGEDLDITTQTNLSSCLERCSAYNEEVNANATSSTSSDGTVLCAGANFWADESLCFLKATTADPFDDTAIDSGLRIGDSTNPDPDPTNPNPDPTDPNPDPTDPDPNNPDGSTTTPPVIPPGVTPGPNGTNSSSTPPAPSGSDAPRNGNGSTIINNNGGDVINNNGNIINNNGDIINNNGDVIGQIGDNYYDINYYNITINGLLPKDILDLLKAGLINYFSNDDIYFYATFCKQCAVYQVFKENGTYAAVPCPSCPPKVYQCPNYETLKPTGPHPPQVAPGAVAGKCVYVPPVCYSCDVVAHPGKTKINTVTAYYTNTSTEKQPAPTVPPVPLPTPVKPVTMETQPVPGAPKPVQTPAAPGKVAPPAKAAPPVAQAAPGKAAPPALAAPAPPGKAAPPAPAAPETPAAPGEAPPAVPGKAAPAPPAVPGEAAPPAVPGEVAPPAAPAVPGQAAPASPERVAGTGTVEAAPSATQGAEVPAATSQLYTGTAQKIGSALFVAVLFSAMSGLLLCL